MCGFVQDVGRKGAASGCVSFEIIQLKALGEGRAKMPNAIATQMADAGFLSVDGIVGEDEASFIAATGLDEVTAKGIYAAAQAVAVLTSAEETPEEDA